MLGKNDVYADVVESLINKKCEDSDLNYEFQNDEQINWEAISDDKKVHFYRIIQESMQNIRKHAKANKVNVNFVRDDNSLQLIVEDDGVGMKVNKVKRGIGVKNIKSRVQQMGGDVNISSEVGKGTRIFVKIDY